MRTSAPRIAVMGSGGVGGYFGARLANAGIDVTFIARGAHLAAMRASGLRIEGPDESVTVGVTATDEPESIGSVDFVLFAVKLWDAADAAARCRPLIGSNTAVVSLLNGIDSEETLASVLGRGHVMGGVAEISATIAAPGHIKKVSPFARIRFGELDGSMSARAQALAELLARAGIGAAASSDINVDIWNKFVFLVGLSAMTALTRRPIGEIRSDPDTRGLLKQIMTETMRVGQAAGVTIADAFVDDRLKFIDTLAPEIRASMAIDLQAQRRLELPWLSGAVVRKGAELGVPTPANDFVCKALKLDTLGANPPITATRC
jgi:2-dehydropantoate 2-reductase